MSVRSRCVKATTKILYFLANLKGDFIQFLALLPTSSSNALEKNAQNNEDSVHIFALVFDRVGICVSILGGE